MGETCPAPQGLRGGALAWLQQPPAPHFVWLHPVNQIPTVTQKNWGLISDADYYQGKAKHRTDTTGSHNQNTQNGLYTSICKVQNVNKIV